MLAEKLLELVTRGYDFKISKSVPNGIRFDISKENVAATEIIDIRPRPRWANTDEKFILTAIDSLEQEIRFIEYMLEVEHA